MKRKSKRHIVVYREGELSPEDLLNFVELKGFYDSWEELNLTDEDLSALQIVIMCDPKRAPVMQGTRSLRKLRYSPESWNTGKSSALRVCYVYFEVYGLVLLCLCFPKNQMENLSAAGKRAINKVIDRVEAAYKRKYGF